MPLKSKRGEEVARALEPILKKQAVNSFQSDFGKELWNPHVKKVINTYKINHYATYSDLKASIVERFNRTIKKKLWKAFTVNGNYKWLELLPQIITEYNNTIHITIIGMKPKDVTKKHEKTILARINKKRKQQKPKFKVNDLVRISKHKTIFLKGILTKLD